MELVGTASVADDKPIMSNAVLLRLAGNVEHVEAPAGEDTQRALSKPLVNGHRESWSNGFGLFALSLSQAAIARKHEFRSRRRFSLSAAVL